MRSDIVSDVLGIISTNLLIAEVLIYSPDYQDIIKRNNFIAVVSAPFIFFHLQFFKNSLMSLEPFLVFALDFIGWIGFTIASFAFSLNSMAYGYFHKPEKME